MTTIKPIGPDPDALLDEQGAARVLGISPRYLQKHRSTGDGPAYVKISARCIRYRRRDLLAWAEARIRTSTAA
jgi:hypothetical protein